MSDANPRGRSGFLDIRTVAEARAIARRFRGQWVAVQSTESGTLLGRCRGFSTPGAWSVRACFGPAHIVIQSTQTGSKHVAVSNIRSITLLHRTI